MVKRNLAVMVALVALTACGGGRGRGGVFAANRGSPNEFAVGRAAPLTVPPDFALVPPRPGAPRPQEADSSQQALNALFGGPQQPSAGETMLLRQAGPGAPAGVRSDVGTNGTNVVNKGAATRDILAAPPSSNPQAEASTGAPTSAEGAATPPSGAATNNAGTAPQGTIPNGPK